MNHYTITLNQKQMSLIAEALDLLQRVQLGQWREIETSLPLKKPIDYNQLHNDMNLIGAILSNHMLDGIDGGFSSLGIGHPSLPESNGVLYDMYKVIRRKLSMQRLIDEGKIQDENVSRNNLPITVDYDEIYRWSNEPLIQIQKVETNE
jgi:hypothetical protein